MKKDIDNRIYFKTDNYDVVKVISGTYRDRDYVISSVAGRYPCAYIESNVNYYRLDPYMISDAHGGLSYFGGINHVKGLDESIYRKLFIGWDYGHEGEYNTHFPNDDDVSYTVEDIVEDIEKVINFIVELESSIKEKSRLITDEERDYLRAVVAPYKNEVKYIIKTNVGTDDKIDRDLERINICIDGYFGEEIVSLPKFFSTTKYTGMTLNRKYNLDILY